MRCRTSRDGHEVRVGVWNVALAEVHRVIYDELCHGKIKLSSRQLYKRIMMDLVSLGTEGIILGCTEIPSLVRPEDVPVPLFDTTRLHTEEAVAAALS